MTLCGATTPYEVLQANFLTMAIVKGDVVAMWTWTLLKLVQVYIVLTS